jgi:hypothetical protein
VRPAAATPAALVCLLGLGACQPDRPSPNLSRAEVAPAPKAAKGGQRPLYRPDGIGKATTALRSRIGSTAGVLSIEIFPDRLLIQVSSGGSDVVAYEWTSEQLRGPLPVELRGSGTLASNLFSFSSVDLAAVPELVRIAGARIDSEHGEVTRILIRRNLPIDDSVVMRAYVTSPIKSGQVDADANGRPTDTGR